MSGALERLRDRIEFHREEEEGGVTCRTNCWCWDAEPAAAELEQLRHRLERAEEALRRISRGNPGRPKWLTDIEMAEIARAALSERERGRMQL